jgi:hypothetical protein
MYVCMYVCMYVYLRLKTTMANSLSEVLAFVNICLFTSVCINFMSDNLVSYFQRYGTRENVNGWSPGQYACDPKFGKKESVLLTPQFYKIQRPRCDY